MRCAAKAGPSSSSSARFTWRILLALGLLQGSIATAQELALLGMETPVPVGRAAGPFYVERRDPGGGPTSGPGSLAVNVSTASPKGQLAADSSGPWSSSL